VSSIDDLAVDERRARSQCFVLPAGSEALLTSQAGPAPSQRLLYTFNALGIGGCPAVLR
jgi:hypothetical protein